MKTVYVLTNNFDLEHIFKKEPDLADIVSGFDSAEKIAGYDQFGGIIIVAFDRKIELDNICRNNEDDKIYMMTESRIIVIMPKNFNLEEKNTYIQKFAYKFSLNSDTIAVFCHPIDMQQLKRTVNEFKSWHPSDSNKKF